MDLSTHPRGVSVRGASRTLALTLTIGLLAACGGSGGGGGGSSPPASLSYGSGPQTFVKGTAITPLAPTITGTLNSFTASPTLPAGLTLDSSGGSISGTPTAVTPTTTYTISAVSGSTTTSATISITVNDTPPPTIAYGSTSYSFSAGVASSTLTPTVGKGGGSIESWSISPALPAGLNFSTTDGSISGTPSAASASASYVLKAQNSGGQSTFNLTIAVGPAPLLVLDHQAQIQTIRETAANVLSVDQDGHWVLWDYVGATRLASGEAGLEIELAGPSAVVHTSTGLNVFSASDGHALGTIPAPSGWWKLATDGSYIASGSGTGLSVWSPAGKLLFSRPGDYSKAQAFSQPSQVLVAGGPAGSVIETISVPGALSTTSPQYNGRFSSWFTDGARFITTAGTAAFIYAVNGSQVGSIANVSTPTVRPEAKNRGDPPLNA